MGNERAKRQSKTKVDIHNMALSIFDKVKQIKARNQEVSKKIDKVELEIREKIEALRKLIDKLDEKDRDLVTVLVINGIHRTADEILIN